MLPFGFELVCPARHHIEYVGRVMGNPIEAQSSALGTARLRTALPEGLSSGLISRARERAAGSASGEVGPLPPYE